MIYEYKVAKIFIYKGLKIAQKGVLICEAKRIGSLIVGIFTRKYFTCFPIIFTSISLYITKESS